MSEIPAARARIMAERPQMSRALRGIGDDAAVIRPSSGHALLLTTDLLAEGIHFGRRAGLDIEKVVDVISKGAAGSWQMENRHKTMNAGKYDFGFAVDWMRKDLGIVLDEADRNGARLPVTALVDQFYKDVQQMGGQRWDTSSLLARLEK